jgi:hypothetical protein
MKYEKKVNLVKPHFLNSEGLAFFAFWFFWLTSISSTAEQSSSYRVE